MAKIDNEKLHEMLETAYHTDVCEERVNEYVDAFSKRKFSIDDIVPCVAGALASTSAFSTLLYYTNGFTNNNVLEYVSAFVLIAIVGGALSTSDSRCRRRDDARMEYNLVRNDALKNIASRQ